MAGIELSAGSTGTSFFWDCLQSAAAAFAADFAAAGFPANADSFRNTYPEAVVAFEAARLISPNRGAIAARAAERTIQQLRFAAADSATSEPLADAMARPHQPLLLEQSPAQGQPRLVPTLPSGLDVAGLGTVAALVDDWQRRHLLTDTAATALRWAGDKAARDRGLTLAGEHLVVLGAAAEVAPIELLLSTGADVLWLDLRPPSPELLGAPNRGAIAWAKNGADLLAAPGAIKQTIIDYAAGRPVHLCLYAYAPGAGRELRLCGAMNAIVDALPREMVKSVSLLISPTSPMELTPEDVAAIALRRNERPRWQALLDRLGRLGTGAVTVDGATVPRSIVPLQGGAYQAAQYLTKRLAAEAWMTRGAGNGSAVIPQSISANVMPITSTRSLAHPLFRAGFVGARQFGVHISSPATTRLLACLLMLYDLFAPEAPSRRPIDRAVTPADLRALGNRQIHGGIGGLPYALNPAITVAALIGMAQKPALLGGFFGGR